MSLAICSLSCDLRKDRPSSPEEQLTNINSKTTLISEFSKSFAAWKASSKSLTSSSVFWGEN